MASNTFLLFVRYVRVDLQSMEQEVDSVSLESVVNLSVMVLAGKS